MGGERAVQDLLHAVGVDPHTPELEKTPQRVVHMLQTMFSGVGVDTKAIWGDIFPTDYEGVVTIQNIPFYSMCEHHLLPFYGTVDICYYPKEGRVVGFSKFRQVVDALAKRPQLQERLTTDIASTIESDLQALGVMVRVKATQLCMLINGDMEQRTQVVTMDSRGLLRESGMLRDEALAIIGGKEEHV